MDSKNEAINKLLDTTNITSPLKINQEEYNILFEDKSSWLKQGFSSSEIDKLTDTAFKKEFDEQVNKQKKYEDYKKALAKIIELQSNSGKIDLSYIQFINYHFPKNLNTVFSFSNCKFYGTTSFMNSTFHKKVYFNNAIFEDEADFKNVIFEHAVNFKVTTFKDEANFWEATFNGDANFRYATFQDETIFQHTTFNEVDFSYSKSKSYIDFSESKFQKINLENSHFIHAKFLNLQNKQGKNLYKENFSNKESARIIKDHFEKQNNITEANKYFALEQNKYLEELKESIYENNYKDFLVVWLNKYVSYFGTDWIRPILILYIFGFFATFIYAIFSTTNDLKNAEIFLDITNKADLLYWNIGGLFLGVLLYLTYHYKKKALFFLTLLGYLLVLYFSDEAQTISNDISKLINPLNIFKSKDYFEHIAPYSLILKAIVATLIYQFIVSFRQNTRRK